MWLHTDFHCFWNSELMTSIMCIHDGEVMYFWSDIDFLEGIVVKIHIHWKFETVKEKLILDFQGKWCYMYDFYHS